MISTSLRILWEQAIGAITKSEVDRSSNEDDRVGLHHAIAPAEAAKIRMIRRDAAAPHCVQEHRGVDHFDELSQFLRRIVPPDIGAGEHHRAFGVMKDVHNLLDVLRIAVSLGLSAVAAGVLHVLFVGNATDNVNRYFKVGGTWNAGSGVTERNRYILRYALDALNLLRELGNRLQESRAVEVLQAAAQVVGDARITADENHRAWCLECVCDAGYGVCNARSRSDDRHARLAGYLCPALSGVGGNLLVPEVYDLDAFVNASLVEIVDMPAVQREDILYTLPFQCFGE